MLASCCICVQTSGLVCLRPKARADALRTARRPPHARCLWLLDSSVALPCPAPQPTTHRFREPKKIRRPRFWTGAWRVSRCVRASRAAPPPPRSKSPGRRARTHPIESITATTASFPSFISQRAVGHDTNSEQRPNTRLHAANYRPDRQRSSRHAAGEHGAAGGPAVGARDDPVADDGRRVGEGAGDRAATGGDAGDAARPPRVRVRALAHRPRREGRGRGRWRRRRSRSQICARVRAEERGEGSGRRAFGVRRAAAGAGAGAGGGEARAEGVGAAAGQREHRRGQLPQQQRRRPAQLLHAAVAHPELHRAAPHQDAVLLRLPEPQRRVRLQQEGKGPGRRDRQVLVVAVGSAVAQVQQAGPGRAAQRERVLHPRRVGRHPQSGQALRSAGQNLSRFFSSAAGCVAGFQLQLCAVRLSVHDVLRVMWYTEFTDAFCLACSL